MKSRRDFIKTVAAAGAATGVAASGVAAAKTDSPQHDTPAAVPPDARAQAMEGEIPDGYTAEQADEYFVRHAGSDYMVDVVKRLGIDYLVSNPGSSFRGFQESMIAYGGNRSPEWITCMHEESSVGMAHGYSKIALKPLAVACHGTVGLMHASMAVYNAWCDQAPVLIFAGNHLDATQRRTGAEWDHSAQDAVKLVRDFIKWDDTPVSPRHFSESVMRAWKIATTPPMGPVVITIDAHLQEEDIAGRIPGIPRVTLSVPPQGDDNALRKAARLLAGAEHPLIIADRVARTPDGVQALVELAEALQVPVIERGGRMNFPNDHYLNQTAQAGGLIAAADVILGLELSDFWGQVNRLPDRVHRVARRRARKDVTLISLGAGDLFYKSNYQNFQRFQSVDLAITGDAQASLPVLTEEVKRALPASRRARLEDRAEECRRAHAQAREDARQAAVYGWNASPVSLARVYMELWEQIRHHDWSLLSRSSRWTRDLWTINRHHQFIGGSGGAGVGYQAPAAAGAALANKAFGRLSVNIQPDGDLMYAPGVLWTAAHHSIPLLSVMHNNRAYQREVMHLQRMGSRRRRGLDEGLAKIGTTIEAPFIDYASVAKGLGIWSTGPIDKPADLAPAIKRAIDVVSRGEPALIDVVTQPR